MRGINNAFNNELEQLEKGALPKGSVFRLGSSTTILQAAGIPIFTLRDGFCKII